VSQTFATFPAIFRSLAVSRGLYAGFGEVLNTRRVRDLERHCDSRGSRLVVEVERPNLGNLQPYSIGDRLS
jgi:hypothetical protein